MNRRTEGLKLSQAIDGFVKYKVVEGLSERTPHRSLIANPREPAHGNQPFPTPGRGFAIVGAAHIHSKLHRVAVFAQGKGMKLGSQRCII
jgi:hypothetical protein